MQQQEICGLLKQILPELEQKIRNELQAQYEDKLNQLEKSYEDEIQSLLNRENQLKSQLDKVLGLLSNRQSQEEEKDKKQLYRRISVLQSQRKHWIKMQQQYQTTIKQMSTLLIELQKGRPLANTSTISNSMINCTSSQYSSIGTVRAPPKSQIPLQSIYKPFKKQQKAVAHKTPLQSQKETKRSEQASQILQGTDNSLYKYLNKTKEVKESSTKENVNWQQESRDNGENREHYHSVLSPPKQQNVQENGDGQGQGKKIFWDQNKKKQLLSLIKFN